MSNATSASDPRNNNCIGCTSTTCDACRIMAQPAGTDAPDTPPILFKEKYHIDNMIVTPRPGKGKKMTHIEKLQHRRGWRQ